MTAAARADASADVVTALRALVAPAVRAPPGLHAATASSRLAAQHAQATGRLPR